MSASPIEEILGQLPIDQLAEQLGVDPSDVSQAAAAVIPSLIGGLQHNADAGQEEAIAGALAQHGASTLLDSDSVDLAAVDTEDGQKIVRHIFGDQSGQLATALGQRTGTQSSLVQKLLPILAPIVLAYLAKKLTGGSAQTSTAASGGNVLTDILGSVLGGSSSGSTQQSAAGGVLGSVLGSILSGGGLDSILGGATSAPAQAQTTMAPESTNTGSLQIDDTAATEQTTQQTGGSIVDDILGSIFGKR